MNKKFYGIVSLLFIACAAITGLLAIASASADWAIVYLLILMMCPSGVLLSFCTKCRCSDDCSHVFPGFILKYLPKRKQTENGYSIIDIATTALCIALIIIFPQIWLISNVLMLVLFWVLAITGFIMIQLRVCPSCSNTICPLCTAISD